ncbi:thiolase C-terminal domain-containing protein [Halogeometricum luteum]|uniref:3-ketoacyl-CoA thiolase n=1 Tax=Halogeometricum luteum TaxID=2950537 RepID=A0ABU2G3S3_9EURY|nr:beta-ketoacyl synthase N-terminal-like domain-containing protein [Halogeometricum sp. S3BR5-2]MDS0294928.1 3-ketoacyl-CoA thiolase [Halogeometricum sp. S3BR5-2]
MHAVRIAGAGSTAFGASPGRTGRDLFGEAARIAIEDSGVPRADIDRLCYANFVGTLTERQGHQGPLMAEAAGVTAPATRYESACASGGVALKSGVEAVRSGAVDAVLVGGMERMHNVTTERATEGLAMAADDLYESRAGATFPGAYALMARAYFEEFGGTRADLAAVAVKNHRNALGNEKAQFQREISTTDVLEAPTVADPLGLYDACPITDGASACVLVSEEYAENHDLNAAVSITGSGQGTDSLALQTRESLTRTPATERAAAVAYDDAGIAPADVDLLEVHDCFTIAEVLALEGLGLYDQGDAIDAATRGETTRDGELPVNLSGGLKAKGHPVGATGVSQVVELTKLLRGDHVNSGAAPDASVAVAHNAGGTVASATVHVLEVCP